ncbi:MAG: 3'-5' exonuclease [Parachlamydiales bacterium]|nr:3'-5' exonuclease [Parachlamydiales bacterium]
MLGIFLDTETNGLNPKIHKIIEIAYKIIDLYSGETKEVYTSVVSQPEDVWEKSNLDSLKINGFTYDEVKKGQNEQIVATQIIKSYEKHKINNENSVFICQNPSFDRTFLFQIIDAETQNLLNWPYHWLDLASMYWSIAIKNAAKQKNYFPWETGFSKDLIASHYNLPSEKKPHRALNGVDHLILCYKSVVGFPFE